LGGSDVDPKFKVFLDLAALLSVAGNFLTDFLRILGVEAVES
jgi:hypothetical protein